MVAFPAALFCCGAQQVVFFLLGALTIVEIMDAHKGRSAAAFGKFFSLSPIGYLKKQANMGVSMVYLYFRVFFLNRVS